jgi:hypothetical protein
VGHKGIRKNNQDCQELEANAPAHQFLAQVGTGSAHHVPQTQEQDNEDGKDGDSRGMIEQRLHQRVLRRNPVVCLSLRQGVGNPQSPEEASAIEAVDITLRQQSITHLKFALGGKSLSFFAASSAHPVARRANSVFSGALRPST